MSVVVINTPMPTNTCLPDTIACEATGLDVAFYANSVVSEDAYGNSSAVLPGYYFGQTALATRSTNDLTVPRVDVPDNESPTYIETLPYYSGVSDTYANIPYNPNNGTFVFSGYFPPSFTGTYSICVEVDSIDNFYLGSDRAFPCGGQSIVPNAGPTLAVTKFGDSEPVCTLQNLVEGFLYSYGRSKVCTAYPQFSSQTSHSQEQQRIWLLRWKARCSLSLAERRQRA